MQFTPQQLSGHGAYGARTLIGNWREDTALRESHAQAFQNNKAQGTSLSDTLRGQFRLPLAEICLTPQHADGFLRYGDLVMLQNVATSNFLGVDVTAAHQPRIGAWNVAGAPATTPSVRYAFTIHRANSKYANAYKLLKEEDIVHYGDSVRLVNEYCCPQGFVSLSSQLLQPTVFSPASRRQEVVVSLSQSPCQLWVIRPAQRASTTIREGEPVPANTPMMLVHQGTGNALSSEKKYLVSSMVGREEEVCCYTHKAQQTKHDNLESRTENLWAFVVAPKGSVFVPFHQEESEDATLALLGVLRGKILERTTPVYDSRSGTCTPATRAGYRQLLQTMRVFDRSGKGSVDRISFVQGFSAYGIPLTGIDADRLFKTFDRDGSGTISLVEFVQAIRGEMPERRRKLVREAFQRLNQNHDDVVTLQELIGVYKKNLERHPEVMKGLKTPTEVLHEFIGSWDLNRDDVITLEEFTRYYSDLGCTIDDEDYFELMIRNAWHISGGEGWCENTTCRRLLAHFFDGSQRVIEITDDLEVSNWEDLDAVRRFLIEKRGYRDLVRVELYGSA